jgi:hypothetical protein
VSAENVNEIISCHQKKIITGKLSREHLVMLNINPVHEGTDYEGLCEWVVDPKI